MSLNLRYMRVADIPQVVAIDRMAFDMPWSARSYTYEVSESTYSHMVALEKVDDEKPSNGFKKLVQNLRGASDEHVIVGYGGLWHIMDEAHISTIATHPDFRRRGWGEILLAGMIRRALTLNAAQIVLEVRVSNEPAQNLYKKYQFEVFAVKPRYYHSNGEDAYDMRLNIGQIPDYRDKFEKRYAELKAAHQFIDTYSEATPPNKQK